jgi:type I restriction enzyme S subunit
MRPPPRGVSSKWLMWCINAPTTRAKIESLQSGTTRKRISRSNLGSVTIPLPPLPEQHRIVEAIEEQLSRLDSAQASLYQARRDIVALTEAAYGLTLNGDWPRVKLSEIARTSSGGTPSRRVAENFGGTIPWVKSGELGDGRVVRTEETITDAGLARSSAKVLRRGTLMIAMYGATIGKLGLLEIEHASTNQAICAIEPEDQDMVPFLWLCLRAMRRTLINSAKGGAQPNISQAVIRSLRIPVPPVSERQRIVAEVERQVTVYEKADAELSSVLRKLKNLRRAILHRAFAGDLLPVDGQK